MAPQIPWKSVAERHWLASLVAGIFLVVLSSSGVPGLGLTILDFNTKIFVLIVGVLLVGSALVFMWSEFHAKPKVTRTSLFDPKTYGVVITAPKANSEVCPPILLKGTIKRSLPPNLELWLFNQGEQNGELAFWPQDRVKVTGKTWTVSYVPKDFLPLEGRTLQIFFADKNGQALIACFRKINKHLAVPTKAHWIGITASALTDDIVLATDPLHLKLTTARSP